MGLMIFLTTYRCVRLKKYSQKGYRIRLVVSCAQFSLPFNRHWQRNKTPALLVHLTRSKPSTVLFACILIEFKYLLQHLFPRSSGRPGTDLREIAIDVVDHFARVHTLFRRIETVLGVFHDHRVVLVGRSSFLALEQ